MMQIFSQSILSRASSSSYQHCRRRQLRRRNQQIRNHDRGDILSKSNGTGVV